jgi:hypothetical protein
MLLFDIINLQLAAMELRPPPFAFRIQETFVRWNAKMAGTNLVLFTVRALQALAS